MGSILKIFTLKNFWYFFSENFLYFLKRTLSLYSSKWNPALFSPSSKNKKIWQEKISYASGNGDPQKLLVLCKKKTVLKFPEVTFRARKMKKPTLKKLLIVQEIKLFNPKLKKLLFFLKERFRLFHSWILLFFFGWFYCGFILHRFVRCFYLPLILLLFFECFHVTNFLYRDFFLSGTSFLCCCTGTATDLRELFLISGVFYLILLREFSTTCLECCRVSHWGSKHRPSPSVCLNHTVFSKRY